MTIRIFPAAGAIDIFRAPLSQRRKSVSHFSPRPTRACIRPRRRRRRCRSRCCICDMPQFLLSFNPERVVPLLCAVFSVHKRNAASLAALYTRVNVIQHTMPHALVLSFSPFRPLFPFSLSFSLCLSSLVSLISLRETSRIDSYLLCLTHPGLHRAGHGTFVHPLLRAACLGAKNNHRKLGLTVDNWTSLDGPFAT